MGRTAPDGNSATDRTELTAGEVAEYLSRHATFLNEHPELLELLTPPAARSGKGVVNMQTFVIERLQGTVRGLRADQGELVAANRDNRTSASRVHAAVLSLYEPGAMNDLVELIKTDLPTILEVDIASLCVESADAPIGPLPASGGVAVVEPGTVEGMIGLGRDVALVADVDTIGVVFGGAASLVKSSALIRLAVAGPARPALLGLGSREASRFEAGQGTELLAFLGQAMGRRLREWLDTAV
jgi:hypothetical protein